LSIPLSDVLLINAKGHVERRSFSTSVNIDLRLTAYLWTTPCGLATPRDRLTARCVQHGVEPNLIYQPSPSPGIKTRSSPAAFPTSLPLPFSPPVSCTAPAGRTSGRTELRLIPASPLQASSTNPSHLTSPISPRRSLGPHFLCIYSVIEPLVCS
jgi:hypothetical protein